MASLEPIKLYKVASVPIYLRVPGVPIDKAVRRRHICFISGNSRWKSRVRTIIYTKEVDVEFEKKLAEIVVMVRAKTAVTTGYEVAKRLKALNYKTNPYISERCAGFYAKSFNDVIHAIETIAEMIEAAAIVNTVWYLKYNTIINLRKLFERGFIPRNKHFKVAIGNINYSTVRVFVNGRVGVSGVHTEESIERFGRQLFSFFKEAGAVK